MSDFKVVATSPDKMSLPTMLSIKELAERTNLSYSFIRKLCLSKKIVYVKSGTKYLINYERFIEFLNKGIE